MNKASLFTLSCHRALLLLVVAAPRASFFGRYTVSACHTSHQGRGNLTCYSVLTTIHAARIQCSGLHRVQPARCGDTLIVVAPHCQRVLIHWCNAATLRSVVCVGLCNQRFVCSCSPWESACPLDHSEKEPPDSSAVCTAVANCLE